MVVLTGLPTKELMRRLPEIVLLRAEQFFSDGYTEQDGCLVVVEESDQLTDFGVVAESGLLEIFEPEPAYEYLEYSLGCWEVVVQIDDTRTVAVFVPDAPWLDSRLRRHLES